MTFDKRKLRFKREIQHVAMHYHDEVMLNRDILEHSDNGMSGLSQQIFQERYDHANQVLSTISKLCDLTLSRPFQYCQVFDTLTKEQHLANLDIMIADRQRLLFSIKELYKGTKLDRERYVAKQIEGLQWYKIKVQNNIIQLEEYKIN